MSQFQPSTRRSESRKGRTWLGVIIACAVTIPIVAILLLTLISGRARHLTAVGQVLETRVVKVGTGESMSGGYALYRIEARVRYTYGGQERERWMTASLLSRSQDELKLQVATSLKTCIVTWDAKHPDNPRCQLNH